MQAKGCMQVTEGEQVTPFKGQRLPTQPTMGQAMGRVHLICWLVADVSSGRQGSHIGIVLQIGLQQNAIIFEQPVTGNLAAYRQILHKLAGAS